MPNVKSAKKRLKQSLKRRERNRQYKSAFKTSLKKAGAALSSSEKEVALGAVTNAVKSADSLAGKGIIHPNKAARKKSRLMKKFNNKFA